MNVSGLMFINEGLREKFRASGVLTLSQLLALQNAPRQRLELALTVGISATELCEIIDYARFYEIDGLYVKHARLLVKVGIGSIDRLAAAVAGDVVNKMIQYHVDGGCIDNIPDVWLVNSWIVKARQMTVSEKALNEKM